MQLAHSTSIVTKLNFSSKKKLIILSFISSPSFLLIPRFLQNIQRKKFRNLEGKSSRNLCSSFISIFKKIFKKISKINNKSKKKNT